MRILTVLAPASILRVWPSDPISIALEAPWCTPGAGITSEVFFMNFRKDTEFWGIFCCCFLKF